MKNTIQFAAILLPFLGFSQIQGTWKGDIQIPMQKLPFVIHIDQINNEWIGEGESPAQTNQKIKFETVSFRNDTLKISEPRLGMNYVGVLKDKSRIEGKFSQRGMSFTLNLERGEYKINRPQTPQPPFLYQSNDITFLNNKAKINLAGTITRPEGKGKFPAIVFVTGSGPQDRDESLMEHKPFLVLADYLTKNGYVVLRYDDRGVGKSEGDFENATSYDFADDAEAAIAYLKKQDYVDVKKIGVLGHSEGGMIAQIIAAKNKDIDFIISLAGPGIANSELMLDQKSEIERKMGIPELTVKMNEQVFGNIYSILKKDIEPKEAEAEIRSYLKAHSVYKNVPEKDLKSLTDLVYEKWFRTFISYDPKVNLNKIKAKVFAINGENDVQVLAKDNLEGWKNGLAHNKNVTIKSYPKLNHLFQESKTGMPDEYQNIETTIESFVLEDIKNWLNQNIK